MPFAATGRSKPHPTTAATSHSARTNHVSVPTPACLLASAASPSTSSSQTRPAPSARTATAPLSRASITCLKSWRFHSVEQPWVVRVETIEHYPPDTKAAETWLYNRQPSKWKRDRSVDAKNEERELTIKIVGGLPE